MSKTYVCPVCRAPRKAELSDQLSVQMHLKIALSVLACAGMVYLIWGLAPALQSLFLYLPFWSGAEFVHWARMREAAKCKACAFDPILYRRDWRAARSKVETKLNTVMDEMKIKSKTNSNSRALANKTPEAPPRSVDKSV